MAECIVCGTQTFVHVGPIPICISCLENPPVVPPRTEQEIRAVLVKRIIDTTLRANAANDTFRSVTSQFPSGLPHPDGTQRIKTVANELSVARKELVIAHRRLNAFMESGIVPKDVQETGD